MTSINETYELTDKGRGAWGRSKPRRDETGRAEHDAGRKGRSRRAAVRDTGPTLSTTWGGIKARDCSTFHAACCLWVTSWLAFPLADVPPTHFCGFKRPIRRAGLG